MDATLLDSLKTVAPLFGSAALAAGVAVDVLTIAFPKRSSAVAIGAAFVVGILAAFVLALATIPEGTVWGRQIVAQVVIVGFMAGGTAAGAKSVSRNADETRRAKVYER